MPKHEFGIMHTLRENYGTMHKKFIYVEIKDFMMEYIK